MSNIDWTRVKESVPKTAHELLDVIQNACEGAQTSSTGQEQDPARMAEMAIREKLSELKQKFERIKGGVK